MPAKDFYLKKWKITSSSGGAFKVGEHLIIEEIVPGGAECKMHWTDADGVKHNLRKVGHDGITNMIGSPAEETTGTKRRWKLTIQQDGAGDNILGTITNVPGKKNPPEAGLAGTWGAEATPPAHRPRPRAGFALEGDGAAP
ncbi:MAG TPA: hypothetical protein VN851_00385 [Thermoanaerobaculia bacterium]|nr:hypothetical protein [Thermoanaerobaculia bacterium]